MEKGKQRNAVKGEDLLGEDVREVLISKGEGPQLLARVAGAGRGI